MKTILVVDDNPDSLFCFEELLQSAGHKVISCKDSRSALIAVYEKKGIDLIITDYRMSGMNGLELVAELRRIAPQIPVIMCSAHLRGDVYSKAIGLGVTEYLQKPVSTSDLNRVIAETFDRTEKQPAMLSAKDLI